MIMAELVSPGVSITVSDESFYAAAGTGTVPLLVIATAQDKNAPDGSSTASYTTAAEAGKLKLITSQRELLSGYGNPIFKTSGGTPLHGHELNEYGLMTAYNFLGIANRAYVLRADVDLSQLEASATAPSADPVDGTYWVDMASTAWGLKRWNGTSWVKQTVKVPTGVNVASNGAPENAYGVDQEYAVVYQDSTGTTLEDIKLYHKVSGAWYHIGSASWKSATQNAGVQGDFQIAEHTALPSVRSASASFASLVTGDLMLQTNAPNNGTDISVKYYSSASDQFVTESVVGKEYSYEAYELYAVTGGATLGDLWADYAGDVATVRIKRHNGSQTNVAESSVAVSDTSVLYADHNDPASIAFKIAVNNRNIVDPTLGNIEVTFYGFNSAGGTYLSVNDMIAAIQSAISAENEVDPANTLSNDLVVTNNNGKISIESRSGYDISLYAGTVAGVLTVLNFVTATPYSNWEDLVFEANTVQPAGDLADGTLWYDSVISSNNIDILFNDQGTWASYDLGGITVSATAPSGPSTDDLWVSTADLESYPRIFKYSGSAWVEIDTADQESDNGIVFGDFRTSASASLDSDLADRGLQASLYPYGILAWNKRASGGNVKSWDATNQRWDDYSGNKIDGSPYMMRKAQRRAVVRQLEAAITTNEEIRNESNRFNLIACPGYPELLDQMADLNRDRKETAFIIGDAPLRLSASGTSLQAWATNSNNASENGEDGLVTNYTYSAVYYPHALTAGLDGTTIVMPSSYVALRTLAFNDQVAYPWFAPAGFQRGVVTNASSVGYIDSDSGEYVPVSLSEGQRDTLYINKVNPIGNFPGRGLAVFGQKTLSPTSSALDRVNVARLVVYIRERLDDIVKPFLFEPNDEITRQNAKVTVDRFLGNLVSQRGLFDFVTVCDESNNTPDRIDRNELWIDVAIQPMKAVEFIYIPIRVQNTLGSTG